MRFSLLDFIWIGREQRHVQRNPLARLFYTLFGALSTHARVRIGATLAAIERLPLPDTARVLEAGSGWGYAILNLARRHPRWQCVGVEVLPGDVEKSRRIAEAEGLTNTRFVPASLTEHDEPADTYDLILSGDVLEHIVEDHLVVAHLYRWLRPGGWLVLHLPKRGRLARRFFPMFRHYQVHDHVREEYTEDEIRRLLTQAGFAIHRVDYTFGPLGELAFELNQLFWTQPPLRFLFALQTFPVALLLACLDFLLPKSSGNAFLVVAYKPRPFGN